MKRIPAFFLLALALMGTQSANALCRCNQLGPNLFRVQQWLDGQWVRVSLKTEAFTVSGNHRTLQACRHAYDNNPAYRQICGSYQEN